mgnify:FL=1
MDYAIREGNYEKLGVQKKDDAVIFTFEGEKEENCSILFYGKKAEPVCKILVPEEYCRGSVRSVAVTGKLWKNLRYNYEINGKIITDTYATRIIGREKWNDKTRSEKDYFICGGAYPQAFDWENDRQPEIKRQQMVMYKLHVRGFSMEDTSCPRKERGTFRAITDKIPYLKKLGITTIELMPAYEFEEQVIPKKTVLPDYLKWESHGEDLIKPESVQPVEKINYWGYVPGNYFAPKASYSSSADAASEFRELVHTLHENGMECVMEFYFAPGMNQNVILDALRFWVREYHVDGFHLQGDSLPVTAAAQDLLLSRTKLFYTHFDPILLENAKKYHHLYVYSDEYLYPARKMLNHMEGNLNEFFCQQRKQNSVEGFVNYITNNNGFTLWDLFSYCEKHNLENGEDNCDGNSFNYSSNCGVEGNTRKRYIDNLRKKQVRNALAMEFLAQGVPLVLGGDEFLNSQQGNNNAYCQDNKTGWLNWKKQKKETWLSEFIKNLTDFRREHPIISSEHPMELNDYGRKGFPDLSYHGESAWISSIPADRQAAGILYCGEYEKKTDQTPDDYIYIGYNFHSGLSHLALPKLPQNKKWYLLMTTAAENSFLPEKEILEDQHLLAIEGQSINIVIGI